LGRGDEVFGRVARDAAHGTGVDGNKDGFSELNHVVGPETVGFAEDGRVTVIFQDDASECISWFDVVDVYKGIGVVVNC
jgi:hypothetical protein